MMNPTKVLKGGLSRYLKKKRYQRMAELIICSYGGVGSKILLRELIGERQDRLLEYCHSHRRYHFRSREVRSKRVIYMFGDPRNALISFFNRRIFNTELHGFHAHRGNPDKYWVVKHAKNIGVNSHLIDPEWDLLAYLRNGRDLLGLEEHFLNWFEGRYTYPVLFVRYETMWDHLPGIYEFVGKPVTETVNFPGKRERGSNWEDQSDEVRDLLNRMYERFTQYLTQCEDIFVRNSKALFL